jgi:hypothetical protein
MVKALSVVVIEVSDGLSDLLPEGMLLSVWEAAQAPQELIEVMECHDAPTRVVLARSEVFLERIVDDQFGVIRFKDSTVYGAIY